MVEVVVVVAGIGLGRLAALAASGGPESGMQT